jgi:hypothetical protein
VQCHLDPLLHPNQPTEPHTLLQGSRTTVYKRCTHDIFATFGECARWDGLVERLTRFTDDSRHAVEEVRSLAVWLAVHDEIHMVAGTTWMHV